MGLKGKTGPPLTSGHPFLLQDLGMESTSLDDVLYRYASFRNLVDPITHDLIISLARYIHCPKPVGQLWSEPATSGGGRRAPFWPERLRVQGGMVATARGPRRTNQRGLGCPPCPKAQHP